MSGVTLSSAVRQNLLALQNTASLLSTTQNRLATGKKVNSALDNPINFFTSSSLSARASDLSQILDSMSNGISTLQAANNGLTSITNTVNSMQATVNQARQDSSWKSTSYNLALTTAFAIPASGAPGSPRVFTADTAVSSSNANVVVTAPVAAGAGQVLPASFGFVAAGALTKTNVAAQTVDELVASINANPSLTGKV